MGDLYEADVLEWSEHQARLLRQHAAGEPGNEAPDWANIIEEVESVGRSEFNTVKSLLVRALTHDLKCIAWPDASYLSHWRSEARAFKLDAAQSYTPSMRQRIDLDRLYANALSIVPEDVDGIPPQPMPPTCTVKLEALLAGECVPSPEP